LALEIIRDIFMLEFSRDVRATTGFRAFIMAQCQAAEITVNIFLSAENIQFASLARIAQINGCKSMTSAFFEKTRVCGRFTGFFGPRPR